MLDRETKKYIRRLHELKQETWAICKILDMSSDEIEDAFNDLIYAIKVVKEVTP
jgi:hypothetical protein